MNGTEQRNARMTKDNVNNPSHYMQAGIECIDAITAAVSGKSGIEAVCVANVIKYLWRYELKNGVEDVKKAQWYLNRLVSELDKPVFSQTKGVNIGAVCQHVWYCETAYGVPTSPYVCRKCGMTK